MNKIKLIDKIFSRVEFNKAFEVYKSKSQILMKKYYSVVSTNALLEYIQVYDDINVSYEIKGIKIYESKIFDLIQEHLDLSSQIILKHCNAIKKEDEKILRNHLIDLINSTNKNFIRTVEAVLDSVGQTQMKLQIKPTLINIKRKANDKIIKELEANIKEHNLSVTFRNKQNKKSRRIKLGYDVIKVSFGFALGYIFKSIL